MEILNRHKNSSGITIKYTINNNGEIIELDVNETRAISRLITNADLLASGEFKAKPGHHIKTYVDTSNLLVTKALPQTTNKTQGKTISEPDYYGREFIGICKRIRQYAILGKLDLITEPRGKNDGKNTHLFKLIEACGISVKQFVYGYLSVIQPYSLSIFQETKLKREKSLEGHSWLCDIGYGVGLVIKINERNKNKPMIISFHESNIHGNNSLGHKDFSDKKCAVIVDKSYELPNGYGVDYKVQRGFIRQNIHSATQYFNKGIALVNYSDIKTVFDDIMSNLFRQLQSNYSNLGVSAVTLSRQNTERLSFMSIGYATVNNIYLMIGLFSKYTDASSRAVISSATHSILNEMDLIDQKLLKEALEDKFRNEYKNELYISIQSSI